MDYLKYITNVERPTPGKKLIHIGDNFLIELTIVTHDRSDKNDLMNWWVRYGYVPFYMYEHISLRTYYTDSYGRCSGKCNPQITSDHTIDFVYVMENTPENEQYLVNECIRRYKEEN